MTIQNPETLKAQLYDRLKSAAEEDRTLQMQSLIDTMPDTRMRQTMQVFFNEGKNDPDAMEMTIDRLAGYWAKYHCDNPVMY